MSEALIHALQHSSDSSRNSLICEKPRMDDVSLSVSLMSTDRPAHLKKLPLCCLPLEICGISHQSLEATNKTSVHYPKKQGMCSESLASRDWDLEQKCFNGRNIKVLDRGEGKGRIIRLEVDMKEMASEECGRDPKDLFSLSQCDSEQRPEGGRRKTSLPVAETVSSWKTVFMSSCHCVPRAQHNDQ